MLTPAQISQNKLLATLPEDCLDSLRPRLEPVSLAIGDVVEQPDSPIS